MDKKSILVPQKIKAQCNEILVRLEHDNNQMDVIHKAFSSFVDNDKVDGAGYGSLKERIREYILILESIKTVNEQDMEDTRLLINLANCAGGGLIGDNILKSKNNAFSSYKSDYSKGEEYAELSKNEDSPISKYYEEMSLFYSSMAENEKKEFLFWREKESLYNQINVGSGYLFAERSSIRKTIEKALEMLLDFSEKEDYNSRLDDDIKEELQQFCKKFCGIYDKGNVSERDKFKIKKWIDEDHELSEEEAAEAKRLIDKYFVEGSIQYDILHSKGIEAAKSYKRVMSSEEYKEYKMMVALNGKVCKINAFWDAVDEDDNEPGYIYFQRDKLFNLDEDSTISGVEQQINAFWITQKHAQMLRVGANVEADSILACYRAGECKETENNK